MFSSMKIQQNQIHQTLSLPHSVEYVRKLLESDQFSHRTALALEVCEHLNFYDLKGKPQQSGCLKALRNLEKKGYFILPKVTGAARRKTPRRCERPIPQPNNVPNNINEIRNLWLCLVRSEWDMRKWNEMMINEHPQKAGPLVGRQLRYLIYSDHGLLGGIGFASAALQLADRDKWIGWNAEQRGKHLHYVVGMSRFLIRPSVSCKNLASKVLSMSLEQMANDFEERYGYRPLLVESFVDDAHHSGTCYRAANWIKIGATKGRGRQDRNDQAALTIKSIYVYKLVDDFRIQMGLSSNAGKEALTITDGLDEDAWAGYEFKDANLGDSRLSDRLVKVATAKAQSLNRAFTGAAKGNLAEVKAYYRFIDQPEESAVTPENILAPHRERTIRRMMGQKIVLAIQDGSDLNFNRLKHCKGLGTIGSNQTSEFKGLHLHSTQAITTDGIPLGILRADFTAPENKSSNSSKPIEEKKTFSWIEHYRHLAEIADTIPNTRIINVCDREADFFELFEEQRKHPSVDLLIRIKQDRKITEEPFTSFAAVHQAPVLSSIQIRVPRKSARVRRGKQKKCPKQLARNAILTIRAKHVEIKPPAHISLDKPFKAWIIHALEENPPEGVEPVEWKILTTVEVNSAQEAEECLRWYCLRWRIEDWHRVLKSGCRIEEISHESSGRLCRAISINLVIAWRIMVMTLLGREQPDLPADVLFTDIEIRTLEAFAKKKNLPPPILVGDAVKLIAKIGGYLGRKSDLPPGHQILWQGYIIFRAMCLGYELSQNDDSS